MLKKLEQYIFYIFLFSIPFQTRKILWYSGWRFNEWTSISVYATDILLIILLFIFWHFNSRQQTLNSKSDSDSRLRTGTFDEKILNKFKFSKSKFQNPDFYLFLFLIISAISIKNSTSPVISWFYWAKFIEFSALYFYLSRYAFARFGLVNFFFVIIAGSVFQAVIGIAQFIKQSSLGFKYFGESVISTDLSGVASFYLPTGEKVIRAYGTTPHPNVLAACLFFAMFGLYFIYLYYRLHSKHSPFFDSWDKAMLGFYGVMLFAFFTTFSRVVVFIWFVSFCLRSAVIRAFKHYRIIFGTEEGKKRITAILLMSLVVIILFSSFYFNEIVSRSSISSEDQAVTLRAFYVDQVLKSGFNWLGVGMGNFVDWFIEKEPFLSQYAYQPIHNIYLLIYFETGIFGLTAFLLFLMFLIKDFISRTALRRSYDLSLLFFFFSLLFIGFFDHFFWTLQQGRLVFWFSLALLTYLSNSDTM